MKFVLGGILFMNRYATVFVSLYGYWQLGPMLIYSENQLSFYSQGAELLKISLTKHNSLKL